MLFPIFNSPKGDWNKYISRKTYSWSTFRFLIPRKGTETNGEQSKDLLIQASFPIFNSPKGDWNKSWMIDATLSRTFRFLIPRKGTETDVAHRPSWV